MENHVSEQLATLLYALMLGSVGAWAYELVRSARSCHRLSHLLDALYVLLWLYGLLRFALYRGQGELRIYVLLGAAAGAVTYWLLAAPLLRPIWEFWLRSGSMMVGILLYPLRLISAITKKVALTAKKTFQFANKYATMKRYQWDYTQIHSHSVGKGGRHAQQKSRKEASQHSGNTGAGGSSGHHGL